MCLDSTAKMIHATAVEKNFWDGEVTIDFLLSKIALIHSECSEVLEALRKEQGSAKVVEEIADVYIRLLDFYEGAKAAGWIDESDSLQDIATKKMVTNSKRPRKHGVLA
jgi:NTP pyrophosphatase (non-canonical NTP hydrolase)